MAVGPTEQEADPRIEFAGRLQALRAAVGLSLRQLEIESERTPRRRAEEPIRLRRSTVAGMTSRERPARPEPANFEVFVDTCLRVAAENGVELPPDLGDRDAWDAAYRQLRSDLDRSRSAPPPPPDVPPAPPARSRRWVLRAAVPATVAVVGAAWLVPEWLRGTPSAAGPADPPVDYNRLGRLVSPPLGADNPVWAVALGQLAGAPVAVVGRADGSVQLWNPVAGVARSAPVTAHDKPVYGIALHGSTAYSAGVDGVLRAWDLRTDPPTSTQLGAPADGGLMSVAAIELGGRPVVVTVGDDKTARVWDPSVPTATGTVLGERLPTEAKSVALGAVGGRTIAMVGGADGSMRVWDLATRSAVGGVLPGHQDVINRIAIGTVRDRNVAVSAGEDGDIRLWDLDAPVPTSTSLGRVRVAVKAVALGDIRDVPVAVTGSDDGETRVWDLEHRRLHGLGLVGPEKGAEAIAFDHDNGRPLVVSGNWDGTIWAWSP
ncbi:hypothetical protein ACQEVB_31725 [Pseudonocardia sp. CA-107938]|uniref:hypothetical protein n=1 Tax=Pseudonocardia sp. CA-107938 TaxID=3240021 RepID=UPI003D909A56